MWTATTTTERAPDAHPAASAPTRSFGTPTPPGARRLLPAVPAIALVALFTVRWSGGWLLLLDTSPGPRSAAWSGPDLPVGIGLRWLVGAVAAVDSSLVGWTVPAAAVVVAYFGGYRVAQLWHGPRGERIGTTAAIVGGCVAATNPFVAARLYSGQIGVLWGAAALWWLVAALLRALDDGGWRAWIAAGVWMAVASAATVHLVVIAVLPIVVAGVVGSRRRGVRHSATRAAGAIATGAAITAVWLVPMLLARSESLGEAGGEDAAHAFASGGSALTLWFRAAGGAAFWRPLPAGSLTAFGLLIAVAWLATAAVWRHGNGHSRDSRHLLLSAAGLAVLAVYAGRGPLASSWTWAVANLWPAGLLREPGKLLMLAVLAPACGAAVAAQRVSARNRRAGAALVAAVVVAMLAAWFGLTDRLAPSEYPAEWVAARSVADADRCGIAVLGDGAYTNPGFTGGRVVAHPARGFLGPRSVVSNDAEMPGLHPRPARSAAERWAAAVNDRYLEVGLPGVETPAIATEASAAGIGWVFVDRPVDRPGIVEDLRAGGFVPEYESDRADMWRAPGGCS